MQPAGLSSAAPSLATQFWRHVDPLMLKSCLAFLDFASIQTVARLNRHCLFSIHVKQIIYSQREPMAAKGYELLLKIQQIFKLSLFPSAHVHHFFWQSLPKLHPSLSTIARQMPNLETFNAGTHISDDDLKHLRPLPLRSLNLAFCEELTDQGLLTLSSLTTLKSLELQNTPITDTGLLTLSCLTALRYLNMGGCDITDQGLSVFRHFALLEHVTLQACSKITDKGLLHFSTSVLTILNLEGCKLISNLSLKHVLGQLTTLQALNLNQCKLVTDEGVLALKNLQALRSLNLSECQVSDNGLKQLAIFSQLNTLTLSYCSLITSSGVIFLNALSRLERLYFSGTAIDDAGIALLSHVLPLKTLDISYCSLVSSACLTSLRSFPQLQYLGLTGCLLIDDDSVKLLCEGFPSLRTLHLSQCSLTDAVIPYLMQIKSLKCVYLEQCPQISGDARERLRAHCTVL